MPKKRSETLDVMCCLEMKEFEESRGSGRVYYALPRLKEIPESIKHLIIHGHGNACVIGDEGFKYRYSAAKLAAVLFSLLSRKKDQDGLVIDLRSCNTGSCVSASINSTYASDLAESLILLGCQNFSVRGYSGFISQKSPDKIGVYPRCNDMTGGTTVKIASDIGGKVVIAKSPGACLEYRVLEAGIVTMPDHSIPVTRDPYSGEKESEHYWLNFRAEEGAKLRSVIARAFPSASTVFAGAGIPDDAGCTAAFLSVMCSGNGTVRGAVEGAPSV